MAEKILVNYNHQTHDGQTALNVIGSTTDLTLRTVTAYNDSNCLHIRKFGTAYEITDVTDIEDPVDTDMTFKVYALDGTLLGSRTGGGAFVDGATLGTAQGCYLKVEATGACTVLTGITIDTDVDAGGKDFTFPAEVLAVSESIIYYLSATGSTYYDSAMRYGGARHTPDGKELLPYFTISSAISAVDSYHVILTVLDSESYDEELDLNFPGLILQSALSQTPTITNGFGARSTREASAQYNSLTACYFNESGNDSTGNGKWHTPYATPGAAITNRGTKDVVYGGLGATVNGGIFNITAELSIGDFDFVSDYGYLPVLRVYSMAGYRVIKLNHNNSVVYGFTIDGTLYATSVQAFYNATTWTGVIKDCTIKYCAYGIYMNNKIFNGLITKNEFSYCSAYGIYDYQTGNWGGDITKNIFHNGDYGISREAIGNGVVGSGKVDNNLIYSISYGLRINCITGSPSYPSYTGNIENNTIAYCSYGIYLYCGENADGITNIKNNIVYSNTNDLYSSSGGATKTTITYTNYANVYGDITIGAGCITTNPLYSRTTAPYQLGILPNSGAYRTDGNTDDMGIHFRLIELNESDIEINGFNIDGKNQYNNAIFKLDTADHIGLTLKWCDIYNFQGQAFDIYDDDTNTDVSVSNCKIYDNGMGFNFVYGGNSITESIIYKNTNYGVYIKTGTTSIDHSVFYGNNYGLYNSDTVGNFSVIDSTTSENSLLGIYSTVSMIVTYSCMSDGVSSSVDVSDPSNIISNPLLVNTNDDEEDFNIKTAELYFIKESPCKEVASDGYDIGAYLISRTFDYDFWKKYEFDFNPQVEWETDAKGYSMFEDALGSKDNFAQSHKRRFIFDFGKNKQVSNERLRQKMEYFCSLIKTTENKLLDDQTIFRLHFQPTSYLVAKHTSVITADSTTSTRKNITDSSKDMIENQWKGYHMGIISTSGNATGSIVGSTMVVNPSPVWTTNQWMGYYFYYGGLYYFITSNSADTLTLNNPDLTLSNVSNINWSIEKYYKILSNTATVFSVYDPDNEIVSGTYDYYIDFIECKIFQDTFRYSQPRFLWTREYSKTGFQVIFEEI